MNIPESCVIVIKGGGEMASGVATRLHRAGFGRILMLETAAPLAVRRTVSFCEAVYDGEQRVEGLVARRAERSDSVEAIWRSGMLAVMVDPAWESLRRFQPRVSIDAVLAKRNLGTAIDEAPLVIALGPGFRAGRDAHRVVETQRGHNLARLYDEGEAEPNTGVPGNIGGYDRERVLRAGVAGKVENCRSIGDAVRKGDVICRVGGVAAPAAIDGVLRGCIRDGVTVPAGCKIGDIDPRGRKEYCFTVSEKARALGGAVLEAVCAHVFT